MKKVIVPVVMIMTLSLAGTAMAYGGGHNGGGHNGGRHNGYRNNMQTGLTPQKQLEVKAIYDKYENEFNTLKSQMWAKRSELNALVASGKAEKKDISTLVNDMAALKDKGYNLRQKVSSEIEQKTGIAMPDNALERSFANNGRSGHSNRRDHTRNGGNCWNQNF